MIKTKHILTRYSSLLMQTLQALLLASLLPVFVSSCATGEDSDAAIHRGTDSSTVHLTFYISDGPMSRAITSANENLVSDITVLIFDNNGSLIGRSYAGTVASMDVPVNARSSTGCIIYAIANTGSSGYFAGINTINQLNAMSTTIATAGALESNGSTSGSTGAMMIGKTPGVDITSAGTNKFSVNLYHQCSKFTFTITPASGVTVTGYQLCNVPLSSYITDSHVPTTSSTVAGPPAGAASYGNLDAVSGLTNTSVFSKTYYIYENLCGSNSSVTDEKSRNSANAPISASASASYLLVYAKSSSWASTYRIYLGGVTNTSPTTTDLTNFNVYRNLNYQCGITLGTSGGNGDARVTYIATAPAALKQFLFSDGTYGTISDNPGKTPVAIVFCITPSTADKAKNYHGYAMALKNASNSTTSWGQAGSTLTGSASTTLSITDYDGLTYTGKINNSTYPAAYAAASTFKSTVPAPSGTSGWYLPSIGQWYQICVNLGGMSTSFTDYRTSGYLYWSGQSTACVNAINTAMSEAGSGKYDEFSVAANQFYWSSSEYDASYAYDAGFCSNGSMYLNRSSKGIGFYVRPVIAF